LELGFGAWCVLVADGETGDGTRYPYLLKTKRGNLNFGYILIFEEITSRDSTNKIIFYIFLKKPFSTPTYSRLYA